jgi:hypothetical protein
VSTNDVRHIAYAARDLVEKLGWTNLMLAWIAIELTVLNAVLAMRIL